MMPAHYRRCLRPVTLRTAMALAALFLGFPTASHARADGAASPVVVELFTSQGCSSCPPADAYLGDLAKRKDVLGLGFHVDYWNYIGWTDPFSSPLATARQRDYASAMNLDSVYTPQMIINGASQGVGSDRDAIDKLILAAEVAKAPQPALTVTHPAGGGIIIHINGAASPGDKSATVWLVTFDREHSTAVAVGENGGRTLKDYQVVRGFRPIGVWTGTPVDIVLGPKDIAWGNSGAAALLQTGGSGPIIATALLAPGA